MRMVLGILKWFVIVVGVLLAILLVILVVLPPLFRPLTNRWGATPAEVAERLPGDTLVKSPQQNSTRAITIDARPELVFALLRQMGYKRGGWYAWDWFYNATGSADFVDGHHTTRIDPRLQKFGVGDTMWINKMVGYRVLADKPPATLVMFMKKDGSGKDLEPTQKSPVTSELSWAWIVRPVKGGKSRLILRTRSANIGQPGWVQWLYDQPLEFGGAIFGYKTLVGIKHTAESLTRAGVVVNAAGAQTAGPQ